MYLDRPCSPVPTRPAWPLSPTGFPPVRSLAKTVCGRCGGSGQSWVQKKEFVACGRCGGAGGKKSGKVWVPCSGCRGAGGKNQTTNVMGKCSGCSGRGSW